MEEEQEKEDKGPEEWKTMERKTHRRRMKRWRKKEEQKVFHNGVQVLATEA